MIDLLINMDDWAEESFVFSGEIYGKWQIFKVFFAIFRCC